MDVRGINLTVGDRMTGARGGSDVRGGPPAKKCRRPLEVGKDKEKLSPLKPPEGICPADTLMLGS